MQVFPRARISALIRHSPALQGALWMLGGAACFSTMNAIVRHLAADLDPLVIVFFRCLLGLIATAPWLIHSGLGSLRPKRPGLHVMRALIAMVAMAAWFHGLKLMPLAEATALSFTTPLFAQIAAVLLLGEVMRFRRWSATALGLIGMVIILRPGVIPLTEATGFVLGAALLMSISQTMVKVAARSEHANAIVFWLVLLLTPMSLIPASLVWQTPDLEQFAWLVALGVVATIGHQSMARALALADAGAVLPLDFMRLPFAAAIGYFAFLELPDFWTWVGAAVIMASSLYIAHREARLGRRGDPALGAQP